LDSKTTRIWRKKYRVAPKPEAVLLCSTAPAVLAKLKGALHLHGLSYSDPAPNSVLIAGDHELLVQVLSQWRSVLSLADAGEVRGTMLESRTPSAQEVARASMRLLDVDDMLSRLDTRWLVQLLASDSYFVVFQPLVAIATCRIIGYECLLRGTREGVEVGADKLFGTAKLLGISRELEHLGWRKAIKQGREVAKRGHLLFLNFTPTAVYDPKFGVERTQAICAQNEMELASLVVEVTEAEKVYDLAYLQIMMREYQAAGAKVALDDLGSGHSSVLHLAELKPDYVKLDQGLVRGAHADNVRTVFLRAVSEAAHELGIQVVAEGVESAEDLKHCIAIGADIVQGYYLARPRPVPPPLSEEAARQLAEWAVVAPHA
jgi:EAL domain-containing protein (putative c-di-GMP-specific phosphodiesterase class I)